MPARTLCPLFAVLFWTMAGFAAEEAYVFSYFSDKAFGGRRGEGAGLHLAVSYDGRVWTALNDDEPVLVPEVGEGKLMRDPSICRGPDGTFHLVWTSGWSEPSIGYATSTNLIQWSAQRELPIMADVPGTRNCWAPEITYNEEDGLFYLYWSSTVTGRHTPIPGMDRREGGLNHRIYLSTTRDFVTFSPPRLWYNPDFSVIDAALVRDPARKGEWLMFVKNENHTPPQKDIHLVRLSSLKDGNFGPVSPALTPRWSEGPSPLRVGSALYVYYDRYTERRCGAIRSTDGGLTWSDVSTELVFPSGLRHGTAVAVDKALVDRLRGLPVLNRTASDAAEEPPPDITLLELTFSAEKRNALGERVRLTGEIVDVVRGPDSVHLLLDDWHGSCRVIVPLAGKGDAPSSWRAGARVRVSGVLSYDYPEGTNVRLEVAGADDVEVLRLPAWWTPRRIAAVIAGLVVLAVSALGWALFLRHRRKEEQRVNDAVQKERLRLSHDLHDGFQQLLAGCMFRLAAAETLLEKGRVDRVTGQLDGLKNSLTHAQDELRAVLWTMKEESEGPAGMGDLFRYAAGRLPQWEGKVFFETVGHERPIDRRLAGGFLMILQEAVGNALRHGRAARVVVRVTFGRHGLALVIADDGCGFDAEHWSDAAGVHLGLASMRNRAVKLGCRFAVRSRPGRGTEVKIIRREKP